MNGLLKKLTLLVIFVAAVAGIYYGAMMVGGGGTQIPGIAILAGSGLVILTVFGKGFYHVLN